MNTEVVIVAGARTPMGCFQGVFNHTSAVTLGATAMRATVERSGVNTADIDEVIMGCVLPAGLGQGPARIASRSAGIPDAVGCVTINKLCGSGMKSVMFAHDLIQTGTNKVVLAGGFESMSGAPYLLKKARSGYRMGHGEICDHMFMDGLEDFDTKSLMGTFAENTADSYEFTRKDMDDFAITSLKRAQHASESGYFKEEIVPVTVRYKKKENIITTDEQPFAVDPAKIPHLKPAFSKDGKITAANSSSISDGAAAVLLMKDSVAQDHGLPVLAKITGHSTYACHPAKFTTAPVGAISALFKKTGWNKETVDLFEINEAFAVVTMAAMHDHGLPHEKVNIHGGACALGHPIGASGCRILLTLIYALRQRQAKRGVACLCIGGGEATAIGVEII
ncbi:MAG: acetyl-CoA C-acyltransferase [Endozoicomonadaceae bacterium]|nr:acetyl-CoA C-acyltransferase [Endozoicomonadaceae bacterium]